MKIICQWFILFFGLFAVGAFGQTCPYWFDENSNGFPEWFTRCQNCDGNDPPGDMWIDDWSDILVNTTDLGLFRWFSWTWSSVPNGGTYFNRYVFDEPQPDLDGNTYEVWAFQESFVSNGDREPDWWGTNLVALWGRAVIVDDPLDPDNPIILLEEIVEIPMELVSESEEGPNETYGWNYCAWWTATFTIPESPQPGRVFAIGLDEYRAYGPPSNFPETNRGDYIDQKTVSQYFRIEPLYSPELVDRAKVEDAMVVPLTARSLER